MIFIGIDCAGYVIFGHFFSGSAPYKWLLFSLQCIEFNKLYIKIMANVSAFIFYLNELHMYNVFADIQGFTSPPTFDEKSKMANKDGLKRTPWDTNWQWVHQNLFSRHPEDSQNVG